MIDEKGTNLGVLAKDAALGLARERGLDLIEVSPGAKPPVARIINFDKFRYEEEKKEKKRRAEQRTQESKQVQVSGRTARNDLEIKARKVEQFLGEGHHVVVLMTLRGREKAHKDRAFQKLDDFLGIIKANYKVIFAPRAGMRGIAVTLAEK